MKKYLLTVVMGTMMASSTVFAADTISQTPNEMPLVSMYRNGEADNMLPDLTNNSDVLVKKVNFHQFNKEEVDAKVKKRKEAFINRLNLTAEQKKQAEEIHRKSMDEMKPILKQIKELHEKAREIRQKNKVQFEKLLTSEQKKILEQMHQERQTQMKKHFQKR